MTKKSIHPLLSCFIFFLVTQASAQLPVINSHPRIFLDSTSKAVLLAKKAANDPDWVALKAEADNYSLRPVLSWDGTNASVWNTAYIFYSYCGSSWDDAAFSLGMAHQLTKGYNIGAFPTAYSNKMLQLADSIISAYNRFPPCNGCTNIFQFNSSYATRHVGNAIAAIYDWCYDELGPTRKAALIAMINNWFAYMRVPYNVYQNTVSATGNYYFGHVMCAAYLGYATMYDNATAQEMIDFARQRVLGTQSGSLLPTDLTTHWLKQTYTGGIPTSASSSYLGPANYVTAPQKDGMPVQGWSYTGETFSRVVDYCFMVKSATGERISDSLDPWMSKVSLAFAQAVHPNRFQLDNSNDEGSFVGSLLSYGLPLRMAAALEGTAQGPYAQYFYKNWIRPVTLTAAWNHGYPALNWAKLLYENPARPSTAFSYPTHYPTPSNYVNNSVIINQGMPKYYMREDWSDTATWCAINVSGAFYDDHDHHNAGHFQIVRGDSHDGDDLLLVGANEVGNPGSFGRNGVEGGTSYFLGGCASNTLFFDDFHDYTPVNNSGYYVGGQTFWGYDEPTHTELNDTFTYIRADLTSAYHRKGELADAVNRTLKYFYRSFVYLRNTDIFLVYDKILAKNSTNIAGQYNKHLRWHFLEDPTVNGNNVTAVKDNSQLFVHTVIPASVTINKVNELTNPDNSWGSGLNWAFNTNTWRAEVSVPGNPLKEDILTVMQPGSNAATEMVTTAIATIQNNMEGSLVQLNGAQDLVFFNTDTSKYLVPVTMTSYLFTWAPNTIHTLVGMVPGAKYLVDYNGITVVVTQDAAGNETASPSGVLRFGVPPNNPPVAVDDTLTVQQDSSICIALSAIASDPDADSLTYTILCAPANGTAILVNGDTLCYTPTPGYFGGDSLCIAVCDPGALCDTSEIWINVTPTVGIDKSLASNLADFKLFPNPSHGSVHCLWTNAAGGFSTIEITNIYGQMIKSYSLTSGQKEMKIEIEGQGVYYVSLKGGAGIVTRKVVVGR